MNSVSMDVSSRIQYFRVFLLGVSAFIFNTTEFIPVGLLSDIAFSFAISPENVGWMLTIYAWIVALMSLPMMLLTRKLERKTLLISLFALFVASHILSFFAWNFSILLISRIGIAFAHALFWSITASIAIRVAPPSKQIFALSVLSTGTGLALVLGVPAGRLIGQWFGWRTTFAVIGAMAFVIGLSLYYLLPRLPSLSSGSLDKVTAVFKNRLLLMMYFCIFLIFSSHYVAYSYIELFLQEFGALSANFTTVILLLFGLAGVFGSVTFSFFGSKSHNAMLMVNCLSICLSMLALYFVAQSQLGSGITIVFWGVGLMIMALGMQVKVLAVDKDAADIIMSLFSGVINIGIGAGALIGNQVIQNVGLPYIGFSGAFIALMAFAVLAFILRKSQQAS